jgi:hypothetical protein
VRGFISHSPIGIDDAVFISNTALGSTAVVLNEEYRAPTDYASPDSDVQWCVLPLLYLCCMPVSRVALDDLLLLCM